MATTAEPRPTVDAEDGELMRNAVTLQLRKDRVPPPEWIYDEGTEDFGSAPIRKDCFVSRQYHEQEATHLWPKVWQMACRERDIPNPGDFTTYEIVNDSILIVRQGDGGLRAYHNVCLHRGNRLVEGCGSVGPQGGFSCTFHGWTWHADGSLARVPCRWDFPRVADGSYRLHEVRVDTWDGWVFVNVDPNCQPLAAFLGEVVPRHFQAWPMANRRIVAYGAMVMPCNWKVALAAFMEDYHVMRTHPESLPYAYTAGARYDQWGYHARFIQLVGRPSPHLPPGTYDEQDVVDAMLGQAMQVGAEGEVPKIPDGMTARSFLAEINRQGLGQAYRLDLSSVSDTEVLDAIEYYVFPNFSPWGAYSFPIVYRVRPDGDRHESCFFEAMLAAPDGDDPGPDVPMTVLDWGASWTEVPGMTGVGAILDQDMQNIRKLQLGLRSRGLTEVSFSASMEGNIRAMHQGVDDYIAAGSGGAPALATSTKGAMRR